MGPRRRKRTGTERQGRPWRRRSLCAERPSLTAATHRLRPGAGRGGGADGTGPLLAAAQGGHGVTSSGRDGRSGGGRGGRGRSLRGPALRARGRAVRVLKGPRAGNLLSARAHSCGEEGEHTHACTCLHPREWVHTYACTHYGEVHTRMHTVAGVNTWMHTPVCSRTWVHMHACTTKRCTCACMHTELQRGGR